MRVENGCLSRRFLTVVTLSLAEQSIATLKLLTDTKKAQVTISDAMGKVHFSYQINQLKAGQQISLPIQSLSKGMYWIKVATDAGTETEKLLKN